MTSEHGVVLDVGLATRGTKRIAGLLHGQEPHPNHLEIDVLLVVGDLLESNRIARIARQRRQALHGLTRNQTLVAAVQLGHRFLDQRHPELFARRLRVQQVAVRVARKQVVQDNGLPLAVVTQPHEIAALRAVLFRDYDLVQELGLFQNNGKTFKIQQQKIKIKNK